MVPVLGLFATAAVVGIGAAIGWRLARDHVMPLVAPGNDAPGGRARRPQIIDADYVDVTGTAAPDGAEAPQGRARR